jgi:hypothetical protein
MSRECKIRKTCAHVGCVDFQIYIYATQREARESNSRGHPWYCSRHTNPESILSVANPIRETVMASVATEGCGGHLFWDHFGFASGPGFKVWADDFPEGTKLIVTARIEPP